MRLTVTTLMDEIFTFEVSDDMDLENFRALCELETGMPAGEVVVVWNGRPLQDNTRTMSNYGIRDGDVLLLQRLQGLRSQPSHGRPVGRGAGTPMIDFSQIEIPGVGHSQSGPVASTSAAQSSDMSEDPSVLREMLLASPHDLAMLKERNPLLSEALLSGSLERFTTVLSQQREERAVREREHVRLLTADPFDAEAQRLIAEDIRLKNIEHNMETAIEHSPENFGQVMMLYINCQVNGHAVKAFVDSGAQMTIMSQACAERCNIMRLVDTRWAGIAKGVGTQKILGRVHLCQIQIGSIFLQTAFSILENQPMDMLLGLDMLKRHQAVIDLRNNVLVIGDVSTRFLDESELPEHARLNQPHDEDRQLDDALRRSQEEANSSQSASAARSGTESAQRQQQIFSDSDIQQLTSMGFPRQKVIDELTAHNGNVDAALASLLAKSLQVP